MAALHPGLVAQLEEVRCAADTTKQSSGAHSAHNVRQGHVVTAAEPADAKEEALPPEPTLRPSHIQRHQEMPIITLRPPAPATRPHNQGDNAANRAQLLRSASTSELVSAPKALSKYSPSSTLESLENMTGSGEVKLETSQGPTRIFTGSRASFDGQSLDQLWTQESIQSAHPRRFGAFWSPLATGRRERILC